MTPPDVERRDGHANRAFAFLFGVLSVVVAPMGWSGARVDAEARDPGVRADASDAGGPLSGLSDADSSLFFSGWQKFKESYSVSGSLETGVGLGPTFNALSCSQCHAQPSAGGASSSPRSPQVRRVVVRNQQLTLDSQPNPQVALGSLHRVPGGAQPVPSFITPDGPVRVARFVEKPDGSPDGEVHALYTIAGRIDAPGCSLAPPDFAKEMKHGNVVFRIPLSTFGDGLIEAIPDAALEDNLRATRAQRRALGIQGRFNRSGPTGAIGRFGWKAQNASLFVFSAEAHNLEIGATNEAYPSKRSVATGCQYPSGEQPTTAADSSVAAERTATFTKVSAEVSSAYAPDAASRVAEFAAFVRLSAPPRPMTQAPSELRGQQLFAAIGCQLCHSPTLVTGASKVSALNEVTVHPYSDFALHHMGATLADHIAQGQAGGDEFRTAPLWGVGQRIFFLHDGRTTDLIAAIEAHAGSGTHAGQGADCSRSRREDSRTAACSSEAAAVIRRFDALVPSQRQEIVDFLRSL